MRWLAVSQKSVRTEKMGWVVELGACDKSSRKFLMPQFGPRSHRKRHKMGSNVSV
jgi:hypothetical protein